MARKDAQFNPWPLITAEEYSQLPLEDEERYRALHEYWVRDYPRSQTGGWAIRFKDDPKVKDFRA